MIRTGLAPQAFSTKSHCFGMISHLLPRSMSRALLWELEGTLFQIIALQILHLIPKIHFYCYLSLFVSPVYHVFYFL